MVSLVCSLPTLTVALLVFGRHTTNPRFQRSAFVLAASTEFTGLESRLEQRSVCIHIYTSRLPHQFSLASDEATEADTRHFKDEGDQAGGCSVGTPSRH